MEFKPLRCEGHRKFVAEEFGVPMVDGEPKGITIKQLMASPKTAALGVEVYGIMREQFSEGAVERTRVDEEIEYRRQLEQLADTLEIFLEETLLELERLNHGPEPKM